MCNYESASNQVIGCGIFGAMSLSNHSCDPAAAGVCHGNIRVMRAIKPIPAGAEVTSSYGESFGATDVDSRKELLKEKFYFSCSCEPCTNRWPTYHQLPTELKLKCLKCSQSIDSGKGRCTNCQINYSKSDHDRGTTLGYDCKEVQNKLGLAVKNYNRAYKKITKGIYSSDYLHTICEVLQLLDKYVQPCKTSFKARETLKYYFDRQGLCTFVSNESVGFIGEL